MIREIKQLTKSGFDKLRKPIFFLVFDSLFHMVNYMMMFFVILDLIKNQFSYEKILVYTVIMGVAFVLRNIVVRIGYTGIQEQGARAIEKMRITLGDHLRNLNLGYFNKNSIGNISNIMTNDLQDFEQVITHTTSDLIKTLILSAYLLIITFFINPMLGLIQLLVVAAAVPIILLGSKKGAKIGAIKKEVMNNVISRMVEYMKGIQVFKSHNLTGEKFKRLEKSFDDLKRESIRTEVAMAPYVLIFQMITDILSPVLLIIATFEFISGSIGKVEYFSFIVISIALTNILRGFSTQYAMLRYLKLASDKLINVYNEKAVGYTTDEPDFKNYDIQFSDVSFEYEKDEGTLKNISFSSPHCTTTALIGPSGSGKTTITSLIARFWDINKGKITLGGQDIRDINPDSLLKHISMIFQEVYLLNDTVENNIKLGNPHATHDEVVQAAKLSRCHDFIVQMDQGYQTVIGEGGSTLSGGEKQRISIARALLKDAPVILLDEATASLDADNEHEIRKALKKVTANKTVVVIAHRLNTIKDADQIIVLNEGRIEEAGSHSELMKNKKRYFNMFTEMENAQSFSL